MQRMNEQATVRLLHAVEIWIMYSVTMSGGVSLKLFSAVNFKLNSTHLAARGTDRINRIPEMSQRSYPQIKCSLKNRWGVAFKWHHMYFIFKMSSGDKATKIPLTLNNRLLLKAFDVSVKQNKHFYRYFCDGSTVSEVIDVRAAVGFRSIQCMCHILRKHC